jgi:hypothetical protein
MHSPINTSSLEIRERLRVLPRLLARQRLGAAVSARRRQCQLL